MSANEPTPITTPGSDDPELAESSQQPRSIEQNVQQSGKFGVNIGEGTGVHIGDIYQGVSAEVIQSIKPADAPKLRSVEELVRQVRSHLHDDIQRLHGTMPLWGMSEPVPLSDLFVDVNLLEEPNSDRRDELPNLWQDFQQGLKHYSSHRSLDRIGLGRELKRVSGLEILAARTRSEEHTSELQSPC